MGKAPFGARDGDVEAPLVRDEAEATLLIRARRAEHDHIRLPALATCHNIVRN